MSVEHFQRQKIHRRDVEPAAERAPTIWNGRLWIPAARERTLANLRLRQHWMQRLFQFAQ